MIEMFRKFLKRELEEIRQHRSRLIILVCCLFFSVAFAVWNFIDGGEEIITVEPSEEKISANKKVVEKNFTAVIGANADVLFVGDPFKVEEEVEPQQVSEEILPPVVAEVALPEKISQPEETFTLLGTAITAEEKSALVLRTKGSSTENIFVKTGDRLNGRQIVEIAEDSLTLEGGEKIFISYK